MYHVKLGQITMELISTCCKWQQVDIISMIIWYMHANKSGLVASAGTSGVSICPHICQYANTFTDPPESISVIPTWSNCALDHWDFSQDIEIHQNLCSGLEDLPCLSRESSRISWWRFLPANLQCLRTGFCDFGINCNWFVSWLDQDGGFSCTSDAFSWVRLIKQLLVSFPLWIFLRL